MKPKGFTVRYSIKAPAAKVFKALTGSREVLAWSAQEGKITARAGGSVMLFDGWVSGKVIACEKDKLLSFTWQPVDWKPMVDSLCTCQFSESGGVTTVTLSHYGFPGADEVKSTRAGWKEYVFGPVKQYLEKKNP